MIVSNLLRLIAEDIQKNQGKAYIVGGAVRDWIMQRSYPKDYDVEVHKLPLQDLKELLSKYGFVDEIGKSFGILNLTTDYDSFDFSIPRRDNNTGIGHTDFEVSFDPHMGLQEAAYRRDFTINTLAYDIVENEVLDPMYGGRDDIFSRTLRHVSVRFAEDPLRVMRGVQFYARFGMNVATKTHRIMSEISLDGISKERIFMEIQKLLLLAPKPSKGFMLMDTLGLLEKLIPEVKAMQGVQQDPEWHPEGDVFIHTMMVIDEAAQLRTNRLVLGDMLHDLALMLGALCHDFGKPKVTKFEKERWRSKEHDIAGVEITEKFIKRFTDHKELNDTVQQFVKYHLSPAMLYNHKDKITDSAIRRLSMKVSIPALVEVARSDHFGRTTSDAIQRQFPAGDWLLERAEALKVIQGEPEPLLKGRHLLFLGLEPGPIIGEITKEAFELQLDGTITNEIEALDWAKKKVDTLQT